MSGGELELVDWLRARLAGAGPRVALGVGDDMAVVRPDGGRPILVTSDMLVDGVHFDTRVHALDLVGRKAIACSLSDCAAMAVRPLCATVSLALPRTFSLTDAQRLLEGMIGTAESFDCDIVGGDTTSWAHPLAIDVAMLATEYDGIPAVRRSGALPGDTVCVTGSLGGSLRGKHLLFTPRVTEARRLAGALGGALHAMMDISDGLALDLFRMCTASGAGAILDIPLLERVISRDARAASAADGRSPLDHALEDGEDFELLLAVGPTAARRWFGGTGDPAGQLGAPAVATPVDQTPLWPIGTIVNSGLAIRDDAGALTPLAPRGYQHRFASPDVAADRR